MVDGARKSGRRGCGALFTPDQTAGESLLLQLVHHCPGSAAAESEDLAVRPAPGDGAEQGLADRLAAHQLGFSGIAVPHVVEGEGHGVAHAELVRRQGLRRKSD